MARIIRGLGLTIIGIILASFGVMSMMGTMTDQTDIFADDFEFDYQYILDNNPFALLLAIVGIILFIVSIPYYWFIEPMRNRKKDSKVYYSQD
ncbi:MAG: hypothetical protein ACXACP_06630 [Candidatus Hodarchaeales archaeon]